MLKYAPGGKHFAFEPIPYLFTQLENKFKNRATIFPFALADKNGSSSFQFVKNAPAYSGINKRKYDISNPDIEEIKVELRTLDELIPSDTKIDLIKIDVEGGEFGVLKGAKNVLIKDRPTVIFECGLGASDYYNTDPSLLYEYMTQTIGLKIFTLKAFIKNNPPLTQKDFEQCYNKNTEYYYVAAV
jgi:FkbM family methyltransferase